MTTPCQTCLGNRVKVVSEPMPSERAVGEQRTPVERVRRCLDPECQSNTEPGLGNIV